MGVFFMLLLTWLNIPFSLSGLNRVTFLLGVYLFVLPVYFACFNSGPRQSTLGKRVCNIYVGNAHDASPITPGKSIGRYLIIQAVVLTKLFFRQRPEDVPSVGLILVVVTLCIVFGGFLLMAGFTPEKTALHDLIFKTRVFRGVPGQTSHGADPDCSPQYILIPVLLVFNAFFLPLFAPMSRSVFILSLAFVSALAYLLMSFYHKRTDIRRYGTYSVATASPYTKKFMVYISPSILLMCMNYGLIFYISMALS